MTYPTPEEIDKIAEDCDMRVEKAGDGTVVLALRDELQAFFLRGIEMGRKMQPDINNTPNVGAGGSGGVYPHEGKSGAVVIRNNTGE